MYIYIIYINDIYIYIYKIYIYISIYIYNQSDQMLFRRHCLDLLLCKVVWIRSFGQYYIRF